MASFPPVLSVTTVGNLNVKHYSILRNLSSMFSTNLNNKSHEVLMFVMFL